MNKVVGGLWILSVIPLFVGCGKVGLFGSPDDQGGAAQATEAAYCPFLPQKSFSPSITVTGKASYFYRDNNSPTATGAVVGTPNPIRYAEVRVTNSSGAIVQCAETDANGNYSLVMPQDSNTYTVHVDSRGLNSHVQASILKSTSSPVFYEISQSFVADNGKTLSDLQAPATGTLEGGAFNILDQIVNANDYLRTQTASCSSTFSGCSAFSVAPKISVYWAPGVNPGDNVGVSSGLSYYAKGNSQLFILGGLNGDVDHSDTDHYDNSVIIHEYGHFIEDMYGHMDSPGGSHDGNQILDPRLAWGEGWADFFQAAVTGNPWYIDTAGTNGGTIATDHFLIQIDYRTDSATNDHVSTAGEGTFREFSVTRSLWDMLTDTYAGSVKNTISSPFQEIWTLVTSSTQGFNTSGTFFRHSQVLFMDQPSLSPSSPGSVSPILTNEDQNANLHYYANILTIPGACANTATIHATDPNEDGSFANSNQMTSNHFYQYFHSGGALTIDLTYTSGSPPADLDLYLYEDGYIYGNEGSITADSINSNSGSTIVPEHISGNYPAGHYMINVMVYTGNGLGTAATYKLLINGQLACPTY